MQLAKGECVMEDLAFLSPQLCIHVSRMSVQSMPMKPELPHRFRSPPTPGEMRQALASQKPETVEGTAAKPFAAMQVIGVISEDGLGMTAWWQEPPEDEEAGEAGAEGEEAAEAVAADEADMDEEGA